MKILAKVAVVFGILLIAAGIIGAAVTLAAGGRDVDADEVRTYGHGMIRFSTAGNNIDSDEYCPMDEYAENGFRHPMFSRTDEYDCPGDYENHEECPFEDEYNADDRVRGAGFGGCHRN